MTTQRLTMKSLAAMALGASLLTAAADANAMTFGFDNITGNSAVNAAIGEAQFFVDVESAAAGEVSFRFRNTGPEPSSIVQTYWDDAAGLLGGISGFTSSPGVFYSNGASPGNVPGGNPFGFDATSAADADNPGGKSNNGVQPGEFVTATFALLGGATLADVLSAIVAGGDDDGTASDDGIRIALHGQSIGASGDSESFINKIPPPMSTAPVPAAFPLLAGAIAIFGIAGVRQRRRSQNG